MSSVKDKTNPIVAGDTKRIDLLERRVERLGMETRIKGICAENTNEIREFLLRLRTQSVNIFPEFGLIDNFIWGSGHV